MQHGSPAIGERLVQMAAFTGFTEEDARLVRRSADSLLPQAGLVVDAVYDHLLAYPESARFFTDASGGPDGEFLSKRKETLAEWLAASMSVRIDQSFAEYVYRVGEAHRRTDVPSRYGRHHQLRADSPGGASCRGTARR